MVLNTILGREEQSKEFRAKLEQVDKEHRLLVDWREKKEEFERARGRYAPKFEP